MPMRRVLTMFQGAWAAAVAALIVLAPPAAAAAPITTTAEYAIIMDHETGAVLYEKNADVPTAPASMSKLMTVAIVFERLKSGELSLDDEFYVSEKAWRMGGSKMWVRVDTKIRLEDLLRGVIVQSGNDACIVIAENIAGSEEAFAEIMTRKAREWGLKNSTFANATGWPDPNHKMSMRDIALLSRKIIRDYPEYYAMFAEREFTWEKIRQANRNPLFDMVEGADGLKTGHTEESGYGLAGTAVRDGVRRIVVFNGTASEKERASEAQRLMRIAFNDFVTKTLYQAGDVVGDALVFKGVEKSAPLIVREPISMILHRSANKVRAKIVYEGPVAAPVAENQQIGYLRVETEAGEAREYPLFAGKTVRELGVFGKIALAAKTLIVGPSQPESEAATP
ncbi:D-alanyl-D-alanine carboxypeptidase (penicillin-binding protein 5/6) [Amphiplicatus metriothermophilus]|uniref:serine-type D-Ala-D-Ala carboxypeptidase n=2 Tax=Amphiplicatus metriothermophilus TaxID=1519374 RepID=A0A239PQ87_9PROT|nr:D-alanyl-D-alanine carboxypeptidase (penicillin-binding protein 5/6) [Amphiplicatus metriothermophilus]